MTLLQIVVFALATWRISSLLVNEDGPRKIFYMWRVYAGIVPVTNIRYDMPNEHYFEISEDFLAQVLSCVWCTSIYVGAAWVVFFLTFPTIAFYAATPFALSACAILFNLVVEKLKS